MNLPLPNLPIGFLTKLGVIVGALSSLLGAAIVLFTDKDLESLGAFILAAQAFYATIKARGEQNAALIVAPAADRNQVKLP